jgi:sensor histidine kinase YesM
MRQIVYESEDTLHPLDREILMVEDYIALQQIRSPQIKLVQWKVTGTTEDVQLPPLIILPLIENCFKHGLIDTTNPLVITITVDETQCCICLNNSLATHQKNQTGGIGLSLTNKRLTAVYGNRSHLTTYKDANGFVQQFTFPLQP